MTTKHVFVIGLDEFNRAELETVSRAREYTFHGLIEHDKIVNPASYDMEEIMAQARQTLSEAPAVDAIYRLLGLPHHFDTARSSSRVGLANADARERALLREQILEPLSANMPETPAPLGITLGRMKGRAYDRSEQTDDAG